jgi:hypothetical protein
MITTDPTKADFTLQNSSGASTENWLAGCMASVDAVLCRNGVELAATEQVKAGYCDLRPQVVLTHPRALALTEYREAIEEISLNDFKARQPHNLTSSRFRS